MKLSDNQFAPSLSPFGAIITEQLVDVDGDRRHFRVFKR